MKFDGLWNVFAFWKSDRRNIWRFSIAVPMSFDGENLKAECHIIPKHHFILWCLSTSHILLMLIFPDLKTLNGLWIRFLLTYQRDGQDMILYKRTQQTKKATEMTFRNFQKGEEHSSRIRSMIQQPLSEQRIAIIKRFPFIDWINGNSRK